MIIGIDPGMTTGIALWQGGDDIPVGIELPMTQMYEWMRDTIGQSDERHQIACEAFIISERTLKATRQNWSLELIGALRWLAWKHGHHFVLQQPAAAKRFVDNDRLRRVGWYVRGGDHSNDAMRHLYLYAVSSKLITPL